MDAPSDLASINDVNAYIPQQPSYVQPSFLSQQPSAYHASYLPQPPYNIFVPQPQTTVSPAQVFPPVTVEPVAHAAGYPDSNPGFNNVPSTYAEMITTAIADLREKDGSSRQAIARYIETHYPYLPESHSNMLTQALKKLKNSGQLVMIKHSYALPSSAPVPLTPLTPGSSSALAPPTEENQSQSPSVSLSKRGPGRPPKLKPQVHPNGNGGFKPVPVGPVSFEPVSIENVTIEPVSMEPESMLVSLGLVDEEPLGLVDEEPKRGRGRPPRAVTAEQQQAPQTPKTGASESGGSSLGKRGRGRPPRPKSLSDVKRGRGRPTRTASLTNVLAVASSSGKRRGRPPKNVALLGGTGGVLLAKRSGRPKAGGMKKTRKLSGRPLGRPKKDASHSRTRASSAQQEMAYQDLKSKAEHLVKWKRNFWQRQSRIKHTISVVKPYFNTEVTESAVGGALKELEELASMDLTAPTTNDVVANREEPVPQN